MENGHLRARFVAPIVIRMRWWWVALGAAHV